ncbi:RNA-binding CRS1 / YhbY (CRM) domain protein [Rhynchospora pubera]|uniref:RNA-binding CRS1 / YhbY (CRM) domain protein n=1 Tax=Rhynchospora pubera TaxID=906938 RepID=A0AAV8GM82_9POAL|nr:RNA-binding CRS1 / YhbY (CRM) domain protein [Rhynchospora pubera]
MGSIHISAQTLRSLSIESTTPSSISSNTMASTSLSLNAPLLRFSLHRPISLASRFFSPLLFPNPLHSSSLRHVSTHTAIATSLLDTAAKLPEFESSEEDREQEEKQKQVVLPRFPVPKLTVKEKKELASYAHSLGKKLKYQQVGKSGVTPAVAASFVQTLEANELLKLKVHGNCPEEFQNVIRLLEESTGSVAVGQIGRSVILYRPSLSKMQKEKTQNGADSASKPRSFKKPSSTSSRFAKPGSTSKVGTNKRGSRASYSKNP